MTQEDSVEKVGAKGKKKKMCGEKLVVVMMMMRVIEYLVIGLMVLLC